MANYPNSAPNLKTSFADNSPYSEELITKGLNGPNEEVNAIATELGTNPKDAAEVNPAATAADVKTLLGQFKKAIRLLLGETNWYDTAAATIQSIWDKFNATTGHTHSGGADDGPQLDQSGLADEAVIEAKILDGAVTTPKIADGNVTQEKIDPDLKYFREGDFDFVASGGVWSADSAGASLNGSMTALVAYINGLRVTASAITARAFTASKDTYVDLGSDGVVDYNEVANNAASPALAANHLRLAIVTTDGTDINAAGNINQGQLATLGPTVSSIILTVCDSLGNLIYNRNPSPGLIGARRIASDQGTFTADTDITGLSVTVLVPANKKLKITALGRMRSSVTADVVALNIKEDGTNVVVLQGSVQPVNSSQLFTGSIMVTPSSGSHTYKISAQRASGTGNITFGASATSPAMIIVELI